MQIPVSIILAPMSISFAIGALFFKRLDRPFQGLTVFLFITLFQQIVAISLADNHISNSPVFHMYAALLPLFYTFLFLNFISEPRIRIAILVFGAFSFVLSIVMSLFFLDIWKFPSLNVAVIYWFIILGSLLTFTDMLDAPDDTPLFSNEKFILITSCFVYYIVTFIIFTSVNAVLREKGRLGTVINLADIISTAFYFFCGYSILLHVIRRRLYV